MRDSLESPRGQRLRVPLEASRAEVRVFSQSRGAGIPLEAKGKGKALRVLAWHNQLGIPDLRVIEVFTHSVRLVVRDIEELTTRQQVYTFTRGS